VLEIYGEDESPNSNLPHHLQEFAKLYEAQGKYEAADGLPGEPWMIWLDSAGREVATQRRKSFTAEADHCRGTPKV